VEAESEMQPFSVLFAEMENRRLIFSRHRFDRVLIHGFLFFGFIILHRGKNSSR
jgi:hypothetical protein